MAKYIKLYQERGWSPMKKIAIVGGTGDPEPGMTLKWAKTGRKIVIDSYKEEKALKAAEEKDSKRCKNRRSR
jgi:predicted dinucleotide-binding enzyme